MAIRIRNGVKERQQIDGSWVVADSADDHAGQALATTGSVSGQSTVGNAALDSALGALDFTGDKESDVGMSDEELAASLKVGAEIVMSPDGGGPSGAVLVGTQGEEILAPEAAELTGEEETDAGDGETFIDDIPGLTSEDTGRSVGGSRRVRERLRHRVGARANRPTSRKTAHVRVPQKAAEVSGPAVDDTTQKRQSKLGLRLHRAGRNGSGSNGSVKVQKTRYVASAVPALLKDRPRWVQDLFEAHFRSESTLQMRRQTTGYTADGRPKNRMKLSREDFAIGWLTAFDKFREDARLLRVRTGEFSLT